MPITQKKRTPVTTLKPLEYAGFGDFFRAAGDASRGLARIKKEQAKSGKKPAGFDEWLVDLNAAIKHGDPKDLKNFTARQFALRFTGTENKWTDTQRESYVQWYLSHGGSNIATDSQLEKRRAEYAYQTIKGARAVDWINLRDADEDTYEQVIESVNDIVKKNFNGYDLKGTHTGSLALGAVATRLATEGLRKAYDENNTDALRNAINRINKLEDTQQISAEEGIRLRELREKYMTKSDTKLDKNQQREDDRKVNEALARNSYAIAHTITDPTKRAFALNRITARKMNATTAYFAKGHPAFVASFKDIEHHVGRSNILGEGALDKVQSLNNQLINLAYPKTQQTKSALGGAPVTAGPKKDQPNPAKARLAYLIQGHLYRQSKSSMSFEDYWRSYPIGMANQVITDMYSAGIDAANVSPNNIRVFAERYDSVKERGADPLTPEQTQAFILALTQAGGDPSKISDIARRLTTGDATQKPDPNWWQGLQRSTKDVIDNLKRWGDEERMKQQMNSNRLQQRAAQKL